MSFQRLYISRKKAEKFILKVEDAIKKPQNSPLLHYAYGIGGIGKSTLMDKLIEKFSSQFQCAKISFDINSSISTPIDLMKTLNDQLNGDTDGWGEDAFKELYDKYNKTLQDLKAEAIKTESPDDQQGLFDLIKQAGQFAKFAIPLFSAVNSGGTTAVVSSVADAAISNAGENTIGKGIDTLVEGGISVLQAADLLKKYKTTKDKPELQELITNPLPKLAKAFIETIVQKSQHKPILLFIDTYEKASSEFDAFLCKFLLSDKKLQNSSVRIVIAGRYSLINKRYQRMFQQHHNLIAEEQLDKFTQEETKAYLQQIGITEPNEISKYWKATKGYPYYLNLIRKQKEDGKNIKLSRGGRDMVDLLLDGLSDTEKRVVSLAAYCRWFDQDILEYLLEKNDISENPAENLSWFDWLISRDFAVDDEHYRLDDVARDVIRQTEHKNKKKKFTQIHQELAEYFQQLANEQVDSEELISEKYEDSEWCEYVTESTYHALFANKNKGQGQLLTGALKNSW